MKEPVLGRPERADPPLRESAWRFAAATAVGVGHARRGQACQDAAAASSWPTVGGDDVFVGVVSDGAGSAQASRLAANLIVDHLTRFVRRHLLYGGEVSEINRELGLQWLKRTRGVLARTSDQLKVPLREFAATVGLAVVGLHRGVFLQIGDAAIVQSNEDSPWSYSHVFWPQRAEYANTTFFLCERDYIKNVRFDSIERNVTEVSLFTDGMIHLLLDYGTQRAHAPFFTGIFPPLRDRSSPIEEIQQDLGRYLNSELINARTTDDKSLVLASRR
jgi:hypothetical protein